MTKTFKTLSTIAIAAAAVAPASAQNLVSNGAFSGGNTDFSSAYVYSPASGLPANTYTVASDPSQWNANFVQFGDHTTGSGLMMIVNGGPTPNEIVWQSDAIAISALNNYFFEAYVRNAFSSNPPVLTFTVSLDGGAEQTLGTLSVPGSTAAWNGLSTTFNAGAATTATLFLRNAQTADFGNDFALDDIYLGTTSVVNPLPPGGVPEPATWALMIGGFGAVGGALRRQGRHRRRARVAFT